MPLNRCGRITCPPPRGRRRVDYLHGMGSDRQADGIWHQRRTSGPAHFAINFLQLRQAAPLVTREHPKGVRQSSLFHIRKARCFLLDRVSLRSARDDAGERLLLHLIVLAIVRAPPSIDPRTNPDSKAFYGTLKNNR